MLPSTPQTIALITGCNRGIGRTLLSTYLSRPSTTAIALVRDPDHPSSQSLTSLHSGKGSKLIVLPYDASSPDSAKEAINALRTGHKITYLDVVVANSGINAFHGPSITATEADFVDHLKVNTIGPVLLFSATLPLLEKSPKPKFFAISSELGSKGRLAPVVGPNWIPYGISKAGLNYAMRKLHFEHTDIVVAPLVPGWVQTDMGSEAAELNGTAEGAPVTPQQSVNGLLKVIDGATRETSGRFWSFEGKEIPW